MMMKCTPHVKRDPAFALPLLLILLLAAVGTEVFSQNGREHRMVLDSRIMAFLQLSMETEGIQGLSVGFMGPGGRQWAAGLGYADVASETPASQYTVYPVASLTKTITNIAVMQMVERGKLQLDDPVSDHLPGFQLPSRFSGKGEITIRHLLAHYGGVPRDLYKGLMTKDPSLRPELIDYLAEQYAAYPPGVKYLYSNLGYELIGQVIESLAGMPYETYVKSGVLEPMGMNHSFFCREAWTDETIASAYIRGDDEAYSEWPGQLSASGGLCSTARDMTSLLNWVLNKGQVPPLAGDTMVSMMLSDQKGEESLDIGLITGWSWVMEEHPHPMEGLYAYQIGSTLHYNAVMAVAPSHGTGVVLLTNTGGVLAALEDMARLIVQLAVQDQTAESFPTHSSPELPPRTVPGAGDMEQVAGHYLLQNELISLSVHKDELLMRTGDRYYETAFHTDGWFSTNEHFRFSSRSWDDRKVLMVERGGRVFPAGIDISDRYVLPDNVFELLGTYCLEGVDPAEEEVIYGEARLLLDGSLLQLTLVLSDHQQKVFGYDEASFYLVPEDRGELVIAGFGMYKGETVFYGQKDGTPFLSFAGLRFLRCQ